MLAECTPLLIGRIGRWLERYYTRVSPWGVDEFIDRQPATKRDKYRAVIGAVPINIIRPFVKVELASVGEYKAPRCVQARDASWLMFVGRLTRPLEEAVWKRDRQRGWFNFAKGYTQRELGRILNDKLKKFECPRVICFDHSRFDGHVTETHNAVFWSFVRKCVKGHEAWVNQAWKGTNQCRARAGMLGWKWRGTVASGDITTSFEDCMLNYAMLRETLASQSIKKSEVLVNGDDSIVIIESKAVFDVRAALLFLRKLNMETKVEYDGMDLTKIKFCQLLLRCDNKGAPMMVHDPSRLETRFGFTHRARQFTPREYQHALGLAYYHIYKGTSYEDVFRRIHEANCTPEDCQRAWEAALRKDPDLAWINRPLYEREQLVAEVSLVQVRERAPEIPEWQPITLPRYEVDHLRRTTLPA